MRWAFRLVVCVIAAIVVGGACAPAKLVGDPLPGALAPDFTLIDGPTGESVTLSSLGGHVILLTFLYTSCVDTCPLTAETVHAARARLRAKEDSVAFTLP